MGKLVQQFMKFGVVGVIAFVIDYGLMVALTELAGVNYLISATISFTVSVVFNYLASMRYVFTHKQGLSRRREFVIFVVLSVIGLGVNDLLMWLGSSVLGVNYLIVKIVATAIVMVYNFVTRKIFLDGDTGAVLEELALATIRGRAVPWAGADSVTGCFCGRKSRRVGYSFGVPFSKNW